MKKKQRRPAHYTPPEILLFSTPFEFISSYSWDKCAERINGRRDDSIWQSKRITISILSVGMNTLRFGIRLKGYGLNGTSGWIVGTLDVETASTTRVKGELGIGPEARFGLILFLIFAGFVCGSLQPQRLGIVMACLLVFGYIWIRYSVSSVKSELKGIFASVFNIDFDYVTHQGIYADSEKSADSISRS